jgi:3-dehydroquinate synthase
VLDDIVIQSHTGPYRVGFHEDLRALKPEFAGVKHHFIIDYNIIRLYQNELTEILDQSNVIVVEATEENKSLAKLIPLIERLIDNKIRRDHVLVAVGGGIVQDITCFIASILLRGVSWKFVPTTLLAQADSCIGSKSSINLSSTKNILGTFKPPVDIFVIPSFLDTLSKKDILSGVGEILKVHAIDGPKSFDKVAEDYLEIVSKTPILYSYVYDSLLIKKRFIEADEFDRGVRNIFNYGHSFGHAIESTTNFLVPHGIAVSMGMDMANFIATKQGLLPEGRRIEMGATLRKNYYEYIGVDIPVETFISALLKDKKNTSSSLGLILLRGGNSEVARVDVPPDEKFKEQCACAIELLRS